MPTRCSPSAAIVPNIVARIAVGIGDEEAVERAPLDDRVAEGDAEPAQAENPSQSVTRRSVALKRSTTTTRIGRYRKT